MWHFDSSLHHVPFTNWGCGLFLFPHLFIMFFKHRLSPLCIPIIGLFVTIIFALCFSIPTVLVSKPEHTSNKTLKHSHCHSTPKFHHNYTLCLSTALLATTSQFWYYLFLFIPLSHAPMITRLISIMYVSLSLALSPIACLYGYGLKRFNKKCCRLRTIAFWLSLWGFK